MISTSFVASPQDPPFDLLIVGAGMVGSTLAAALAHTSVRVGVIEARDLSQGIGPDGRASALALGTVQMLDQIGAWSRMRCLGVSPIRQIQVCDGDRMGLCHLNCEMIQAEALGYIVENQITLQALAQVIESADNIQLIAPARVQRFVDHGDRIQVELVSPEGSFPLPTQLLVAADGGRSAIREQAGIPVTGWGYDQTCVVTTVITEGAHQQVAYERFHPRGPFAILPMTAADLSQPSHRSCVVWTIRSGDRDRLMSLSDPDFITAIAPSFGSHLGQILSVSPRACYVPRRQHSQTYVGARLALVGDAAHSTHPVGGQGVNMGMRDVAALATLIHQAQAQGEDLGSQRLLRTYNRMRRWENWGVLLGTDVANRIFSNALWPLRWSRRFGLLGLDRMTLPKQLLMKQAMGIAPYQPRLEQESVDLGMADVALMP